MAVVHLIHGFVGTGKTTHARRLEQTLPAIRFTHDEWMSRFYGEDPPANEFPEMYRRVAEQIGALWPRCIQHGVSVILDFGFWSRAERDQIRAIANSLGVATRLHALTCPDSVAWQRVSERNAALDGSLFISRETFDLLKARFEPLGDDEQHEVWRT